MIKTIFIRGIPIFKYLTLLEHIDKGTNKTRHRDAIGMSSSRTRAFGK